MYVQVTTSPGTSAMLAMPVAMLVVPLEQTSAVSAQPGTAVSSIVLVPVASAPVKVNVTVFDWRMISPSSSRLKPAPKVPPPVPVVVKAKSWASSGTAFLVTVIVASFVFVYVQVTTSPGTSAMLAMPVAMLVVPLEQTSAVSAQPGTAVSSIVLVPVASAPVKVNVTVFDWRMIRRRRRG